MQIPFISSSFIDQNTDFKDLIHALKIGFSNASDIEIPMRHHHDFKNGEKKADSTLLLMPAWEARKTAGVKVVTVSPDNAKHNLPSVQGIYIHMDASTGVVQSIQDAKALTAKRTAAASALASSFLSRTDSSSLLMIGTGALAPNLIRAHASVRSLDTIYLYGRRKKKAEEISDELKLEGFNVIVVEDYKSVLSDVDIISCATLSETPLIKGAYLRPGQHIDLVGSYRKDMREADDSTLKQSSIFVDTQAAQKESGDILIPIQEEVISSKDIQADLFALCQKRHPGRSSSKEITVFKSVGYALEDLVAANLYFELWNKQ